MLLATSSLAHANTEEQDSTTIVVTATGQSEALSSTKTDTPLIETPQSISIITRAEMDLRGVNTVAEALAYSAGVQAEASGIDSRVDEVSVRGFAAGGFSSSNNFVDGMRLPSGGQWTRTSFDTFGLQQIDVLKGPSSVLYGQVAPGGLVNLVSKRPQNHFGAEVAVQGIGSNDLSRWQGQGSLDIGGPIGDSGLKARFVGLYRDGQTQIDQTSNSRLYLAPSLTFAPTDATSLTLLVQYQRDRGGSTYQFLPYTGTMIETNGGRISKESYLGEPDWNTFDRDQLLVAMLFEHKFGNDVTWRTNARYTDVDTLYRANVLNGDTITTATGCTGIAGCIVGQTIRRRAVQGDGWSSGLAMDNQLEAHFGTGNVEHTLLVGADYFATVWQHHRDSVAPARVLPLLDIFNPVPRGSADFEANRTPAVHTRSNGDQVGIYGQNQMSLGNLRVTVGGRYDWADETQVNQLTQLRTRTKADSFTWRAGAVYLFDNGLAPYLSYSTSFQPSTGQYYDGTPFDPTTGQQWEGGIRWEPNSSNVYLTLGAYQITQQNITTPDPDPAHVCGGGTCQVQTGEARVRGIEFEGRATLPFGVAAIATFTRLWTEVTESNVVAEIGNRLPQTPNYMASGFLHYTVPSGALKGLGFGGGVRYTGDNYGDIINSPRFLAPDYVLADAMMRYDFGEASSAGWAQGLSLSVNARNLFDKTYVAYCATVASCFYGSGRVVNARLQYRW
ncbi:TonB-dependent siderophore receptor [Sandaracinobacter sp. RS1-74]|uniref:TonB-dependent siderophore receptor n=1 Tax=Sandaracinobacteroides sayramensis TaxID=2913411 RepID=UPI001EDB5A20|nr:TonB-dependent siderophore receptor [Sandaracinobacteroides sayramensis]MCG2840670.1 TonB-dependent siderophore receptor [Sandaracinobacteroides sayramensis]